MESSLPAVSSPEIERLVEQLPNLVALSLNYLKYFETLGGNASVCFPEALLNLTPKPKIFSQHFTFQDLLSAAQLLDRAHSSNLIVTGNGLELSSLENIKDCRGSRQEMSCNRTK